MPSRPTPSPLSSQLGTYKPDYGLGFQIKVLVVPSEELYLHSELEARERRRRPIEAADVRILGCRQPAVRPLFSSSAFCFQVSGTPLPSEYGTYKTVRARCWPWLSMYAYLHVESPPSGPWGCG